MNADMIYAVEGMLLRAELIASKGFLSEMA